MKTIISTSGSTAGSSVGSGTFVASGALVGSVVGTAGTSVGVVLGAQALKESIEIIISNTNLRIMVSFSVNTIRLTKRPLPDGQERL
jgi:hypothetical protein